MYEVFDAIKLEIDFNAGSWTDVTSDLLLKPNPKWRRGIMSGKPTARVASVGTFRFALHNPDGKYSPGHASVQAGFGVGNKVRLSFEMEGETFYKFRGRIYKGGVRVLPGTLGQRRTLIIALDWMKVVATHELRLLTMQLNKRADEALEIVDDNLAISPVETSYATGQDTFPRVFHLTRDRTKAIAEINNLVASELGLYYPIGDKTGGETVVLDARFTRATTSSSTTLSKTSKESGFLLNEDESYELNEDGSKIVLSETQAAEFDNLFTDMVIVEGKHLANLIKARTLPVEIDAAATTVLFSLNEVIEIAGLSTEDGLRCAYTDPSGADRKVSGTEMVTPVGTTDYTANAQEDGGGADLTANLTVTATYGSEAVEYILENTGGPALFVTKLQARGKGIYDYQPVDNLREDTDSQAIQGVIPLNVNFKYEANPLVAQSYAEILLSQYREPRISIEKIIFMANYNSMTMFSFLQLEPGTRFTVKETQAALDADYFVMGYSAEIIGGVAVKCTLIPKESGLETAWVLSSSYLSQDTVLAIG